MKLIWNPQAYDDRSAIMDYIAQDNPTAALELDEHIEAQAEGLLDHPELYRRGRMNNTREMVVGRNYVAVYRIDGACIEILRVLHAARQWPPK